MRRANLLHGGIGIAAGRDFARPQEQGVRHIDSRSPLDDSHLPADSFCALPANGFGCTKDRRTAFSESSLTRSVPLLA